MLKISAKKRGFTLIELLVVVLIIGVLTAIALPQYEVAVEKSSLGSLMPMIKSIDSSEHIYFFTNGTYTIDFEALDISMPDGGEMTKYSTSSTMKYPKFYCIISYTSTYCYTKRGMRIEKYYDRSYFMCWALKTDALMQKVCKSISNKESNDGSNSTGYFYSF